MATPTSASISGPSGLAQAQARTQAALSVSRSGFVVNAVTEGQQGSAQLAALPQGGWIAVWMSAPPGSGAGQVRMRRIDADGRPLDPESVVAERGSSPDVAVFADGSFVVTWSSSPAMYEVQAQAQLHDAQGRPLGAPLLLAATGFKYVARPAAMPDGSFIVAADTTYGRWGPEYGVINRYGRDGTVLGTSGPITSDIDPRTGTYDTNSVHDVVAAPLPDGGFVASWIAGGAASSQLRMARFDAAARMQGSARTVASSGTTLRTPALAVLAGGSLALAWDGGDGSGRTTGWLQVFEADGASAPPQALASEAGAWAVQPRLAPLPGGGFAAAWRVVRFGSATMTRIQRLRAFDDRGSAASAVLDVAAIEVPLAATGYVADSMALAPGGAADGWLLLHGSWSEAAGWDVVGTVR